jgi:hypothetical protein
MCRGSDADGEVRNITDSDIRARCEHDVACVGYYSRPSSREGSTGVTYRPVTDWTGTYFPPHVVMPWTAHRRACAHGAPLFPTVAVHFRL